MAMILYGLAYLYVMDLFNSWPVETSEAVIQFVQDSESWLTLTVNHAVYQDQV